MVTVNYTSKTVEAPVPSGAKVIFGQKLVKPGDVCVWRE
jgi:hypothetical protein